MTDTITLTMADNENAPYKTTTEMNSSNHLYCLSLMKYSSQTNGDLDNTSYFRRDLTYNVLQMAQIHQVCDPFQKYL